ncbi:MAG TPA: cytochrome c [Pyrinomonadaceae bacterium]|jgi:mono/diheme cytochrome c family protein|nr:cytochrome c [Pyrinomonadaceae bacterium]
MLKKLKLSLTALFIAGGAVLLASPRAQVDAASSVGASPASGRALYNQNCARCHGSNGRSQTALGRKLEAADLTDDEVQYMDDAKMTRVIKNGRTGMPGFGKKLNADQISAIVTYVRGL